MNTQLDMELVSIVKLRLIGNSFDGIKRPKIFRFVDRQTGEMVRMPNRKYEWKAKNHATCALRQWVDEEVWNFYKHKDMSNITKKQISDDLMEVVLSEILELKEYSL